MVDDGKGASLDMFFGTSVRYLDDKSRLTLPNDDRDSFTNSTVYLTVGFDDTIDLYPEADFAHMSAQISNLDDFDDDNRRLKRYFYSLTMPLKIDSHGRIQLTKPILAKGGLEKSITLVGRGDHLELWDTERFEETMQSMGGGNYSCLAKKCLSNKH